jgi:cell division cycle protein 37
MKIKTRSKEILAERAKEGQTEGVEQIQLHAVEPGTVINIKVPRADSEDPEEQEAREIFEHFAPEMRKALETGNLDEVNKVLGEMPIDEAEELVGLFGEVSHQNLKQSCDTLLTAG